MLLSIFMFSNSIIVLVLYGNFSERLSPLID